MARSCNTGCLLPDFGSKFLSYFSLNSWNAVHLEYRSWLTGLIFTYISEIRHVRWNLRFSRACGMRIISPFSRRMIGPTRWSDWQLDASGLNPGYVSSLRLPGAANTKMTWKIGSIFFHLGILSGHVVVIRLQWSTQLRLLFEVHAFALTPSEPHERLGSATRAPLSPVSNTQLDQTYSHFLWHGPWLRPWSRRCVPIEMHDLISARANMFARQQICRYFSPRLQWCSASVCDLSIQRLSHYNFLEGDLLDRNTTQLPKEAVIWSTFIAKGTWLSVRVAEETHQAGGGSFVR